MKTHHFVRSITFSSLPTASPVVAIFYGDTALSRGRLSSLVNSLSISPQPPATLMSNLSPDNGLEAGHGRVEFTAVKSGNIKGLHHCL